MSDLKNLLDKYKEACLEVGYFGTGDKLAAKHNKENNMNAQVEALKQACKVFYLRERMGGLNMPELLAYKDCVAAVKEAIPGIMWASGEWHTTIFDEAK